LGGLPAQQKGFRQRAAAADLEGTEVLVPIAFRHRRVRVNPKAKMIEVGDTDSPVAHSVYQVRADARRQIAPRLDSWHQLPKTIRPICSPRRLTSSGSEALRKRSARSKNSCCLRFSASMPFSMSSSSIRLALSLRALARLRTWAATFAGKLTLCRTTLFTVPITPLCTKLVCHGGPSVNRQGWPPSVRREPRVTRKGSSRHCHACRNSRAMRFLLALLALLPQKALT